MSVWLQTNEQSFAIRNDAPRSILDEAFYFSIILGSLIVAFSRRVKWSKFLGSSRPLLVVYLFFAISVLWSGDPFGSTKRLCKDFGLLFVISVILSEKDPLEAIQAVYFRCACVLFPLSVIFIRYFPGLGRSYSEGGELTITGVTTQKNSLGEIVLVFGLVLIWDCLDPHPSLARRTRTKIPWDRLLLLLIGFYLLHMSQSKTALMCLLIGSALMLRAGFFLSKPLSRIVLYGALAVPILIFFAQQFASVIAPVVEALGRNMTFTGRTDIWTHVNSATVNPLFGAGYWNFWGGKGGLAIERAMNTVIPNAHNGYLDIYLDGGWLGLLLLFVLLVTSGNRLMNGLRVDRYQRLRFAILIVVIMYNNSESMFFRMSPLWFTTLLAFVNFPSRAGSMLVPHASNDASQHLLAPRLGHRDQRLPISHR